MVIRRRSALLSAQEAWVAKAGGPPQKASSSWRLVLRGLSSVKMGMRVGGAEAANPRTSGLLSYVPYIYIYSVLWEVSFNAVDDLAARFVPRSTLVTTYTRFVFAISWDGE